MDILGWGLAVLIGLSLGLIGGGGSVLAIPVLVYVLGLDPVHATLYALFIVGITALIGVFDYGRKRMIDVRTGLAFAIPSSISVFIGRKYILPAIPDLIFHSRSFELHKGDFIMLVFGILIVFTSFSMIRHKGFNVVHAENTSKEKFLLPYLLLEGVFVGLFTGILGAGGGFLIIPALVVLAGLPMKTAVGTSLLVIAINSLVGFAAGLLKTSPADWTLLLCFSGFTAAGMLLGVNTSVMVGQKTLRHIFGWFTLTIGIVVIVKELIF